MTGSGADATGGPQRLVALMPMRHDSERVPGKNYRPFGDGRPLFHHMLDALAGCPEIDRVVIDTDSPTIKEDCAHRYPDVVVLDRPQRMDGAARGGDSSEPIAADNAWRDLAAYQGYCPHLVYTPALGSMVSIKANSATGRR